jgi:hypothetical protein
MDANTLAVSPHYIDPDLIVQIVQWKRTCETAHGYYSDWISIVELCPVAHSQKASLREEPREIPIQSNFYRFQAFRDKVEDGLSLVWSRHDHADGVYFTNQDHNPGFRYGFPLPVPKHPERDQHDGFGHILRCTAPRGVARFGEIKDDIWSRPLVELVADTGQVIGCIRLQYLRARCYQR